MRDPHRPPQREWGDSSNPPKPRSHLHSPTRTPPNRARLAREIASVRGSGSMGNGHCGPHRALSHSIGSPLRSPIWCCSLCFHACSPLLLRRSVRDASLTVPCGAARLEGSHAVAIAGRQPRCHRHRHRQHRHPTPSDPSCECTLCVCLQDVLRLFSEQRVCRSECLDDVCSAWWTIPSAVVL